MLPARVLAPLGLVLCLVPACDKAAEKALDRCVEGDIQRCSCGEHLGEHTCHDGEYGECDCSQAKRDAAQLEAGMKRADEVLKEAEELDKERKELDKVIGANKIDDERAKLLEEKAALEKKLAEEESAK